MNHPTVSIIMSVYNGENYLNTAIDSILNQSFTDFEFIVINDSSSDTSKLIIQSYEDDRIVYLENEQNIGLAASLNKGIAIAKGKYIARMDDDDVAYPERLNRQISFLEENPEVGVLGTYAKLIGDHKGIRKHSTNSEELKIRTLFSCQFCHPTVMMRKSVLDEHELNYNEEFKTAQDYELWSRLMKYTNFSTLPEILLDYRVHDKQVSCTKRQLQIDSTKHIYQKMISSLNLEFTEEKSTLHRKVAGFQFSQAKQDIPNIGDYFQKLIEANNELEVFPKHYFSVFLSEYFYNIIRNSNFSWKKKSSIYFRAGFNNYFKPQFLKLKFVFNK